MQKLDVLKIEQGMPITVKYGDGQVVNLYIHTYEDKYDDEGMNDDGTPRRITGHQYLTDTDEKHLIVWDVKPDDSKIKRKHRIDQNHNIIESYNEEWELHNVQVL